MNQQEKNKIVEELTSTFNNSDFIYLADSSSMNALDTNKLRREFNKQGVVMRVIKNTLIKRAMEASDKDFTEMYDTLKGNTAVLISENLKAPAQTIKNFRKKSDRPLLKSAYIDSDVFLGDESLKALSELKSKEDLIGEVIGLLQSPTSNVLSALLSGKNTIGGIVKALQDKNN